jgi:quercetin dioxygenase-like cupin family protein
MSRPSNFALATIAACAVWAVASSAGHDEKTARPAIHRPDSLDWQPAPPSLPAGAKIALLEGDPAKPGPFVFRVKFPDGYRVPPHTHPKPERMTVISGTLYFGMGEKFDRAGAREMPAGTFGTWPAGMKHYGWAKGETVLQVHGEGPWTITYVNPADDPRKARK